MGLLGAGGASLTDGKAHLETQCDTCLLLTTGSQVQKHPRMHGNQEQIR